LLCRHTLYPLALNDLPGFDVIITLLSYHCVEKHCG